MTQPIQLRRGTAAEFAAAGTRVYAYGEPLLETSPTLKLKFGDGVTAYTGLPYFATGGGGGGSSTFAGLTDSGSADLPSLNAPLSAALTLLAPKVSPALTGTPTAPTAGAGTNTTQIATTAHVLAERNNAATLTGKTMSGTSNTFSNLPAGGITGIIPIANLGTGAPTGFKFLRDDNTLQTIAGGGDALVANPLSQFAATTSAQLRGVLTDETGTGAAVFAADPVLTGTPSAPTAAAGTSTTQIATTAHVFAERTNAATLTNKTMTSPTLNSPTVNTASLNGTMGGTGTLPSTVTMAASPSQADNSLKIATTAYVDTLGATKVTALAAVDVSAVATLTTASHSNRHLYATTDANVTRSLPSSGQTTGDFVEYTNRGAVRHTFTGGVAAPGMVVYADTGETIQFVYNGAQWDALTPANPATVPTAGDKSANYTTVLTDAGKRIRHPSTDANARTFTIDGTLAYIDGTVMTFPNRTSQVLSIVLTGGSGTLRLAGTTTTGTRSVAQHGYCVVTLDGGDWLASGPGVT